MSNSLQPHALQHTRLLCLLLSPRFCSNSCLLSQRCYLVLSSTTFSSSFPFSFNRTQHQGNMYQFSSVVQSYLTLGDPMNCSMPGLPVHHQIPEFTETHVHRVSDAIHPSHSLSSPSPPAPNPSQHQSLFQGVNSLHEVAKVLEFQL